MRSTVLIVIGWLQLVPMPALAQESPSHRLEVFATIGGASVSRYQSETSFGSGPALGMGVAIRWLSRLWLDAEASEIRGLKESVDSAAAVSAVVAYDLVGSKRARLYLFGGPAMLLTRHTADALNAAHNEVGWGLDVGMGVRLALSPRVSIRPELRYLDAPWLSRTNLGLTRASVAMGYHW